MSLSWGNRRYRPVAPTTKVNNDGNNGNKFRRGAVLTGSFIQPNQDEDIIPPSPTPTPSITPTLTPTPSPIPETFHILAEDNSPILTEGGDNIDFDFVIPPTPTPTPSITPTLTSSPTPTPTPGLSPTPTPSPIPFSPTIIPNLTNWWESESGVITDGTNVISWTDSISSVVGTRNTTSAFNNTTDVLNGYTGITTTGLNSQLNLSPTLNLSLTTIFIVFKSVQSSAIHYMLGDNSSGFFTHFSSPQGIGIFNNPDVAAGGINTNTEQYGTFQMDATDYYVRQNGIQVNTTPIGSGGNITINHLFRGNSQASTNGTIWEILIYNRALNGTEIGQVETYIQNKYGL
jgi:hypothetical protein